MSSRLAVLLLEWAPQRCRAELGRALQLSIAYWGNKERSMEEIYRERIVRVEHAVLRGQRPRSRDLRRVHLYR